MKHPTTPKPKTGRKPIPHHASWGETIDGLYRCPDGRWRIVATGERYTEHDERRAVQKFRQWQATQRGDETLIPLTTSSDHDAMEMMGPWLRGVPAGDHHLRDDVVLRIPQTSTEVAQFLRSIPTAIIGEWLHNELIERPKFWAQQSGVEQLGYLLDLKKPTPSPTLVEVGNLFFNHKKISENWMAKSKAFWQEFSDSVEVATLREITQQAVLDYGDNLIDLVCTGERSPTYARQRIQAIKAILAWPPKRGQWVEDVQRIKAYLIALVPPEQVSPNPMPISRTHYRALLDGADEQMKCILLCMLNFCMYGGEVASLHWADLDMNNGELVTRRLKTGVIRVATLWPQTVEALAKLPRNVPHVFTTSGTKMQHNYQTVYKAFKFLRKSIKVDGIDEVQLSHIRDGAYTTAARSCDLDTCRLLAGHATGQSDRYVQRNPQKVAPVCRAIEQFYFRGKENEADGR